MSLKDLVKVFKHGVTSAVRKKFLEAQSDVPLSSPATDSDMIEDACATFILMAKNRISRAARADLADSLRAQLTVGALSQ